MTCTRAISLVAALCSTALWSLPASANGGHFQVEDSSLIPPQSCSLETWGTREEPNTTWVTNPTCNFTGGSDWSLPVTYDVERDDIASVGLEYKRVLLNTGSGPALALMAGGQYQRATEEVDELFVKIPLSFQPMDMLALHVNGGVLHDRPADETYATWGLAATVKTISGPVLIAEMVDDDRREPLYGLGARFNIGSTRWTLDLGVSRDTQVDETAYTLGLNIPRLF